MKSHHASTVRNSYSSCNNPAFATKNVANNAILFLTRRKPLTDLNLRRAKEMFLSFALLWPVIF